ncbi:MAG: tetratricopeptide repeat protein [Ferruginibacter sp.]
MSGLQFFFIYIISLTLLSCNNTNNNNEVTNDPSLINDEKQLRTLISQYPDSLLLRENLVQYFRDNSNYGQAIAETDSILKLDSTNTRFLEIKAVLFFENDDTLNAIKTFEKAILINAQPEYIIPLGTLYAQTKNKKALAMADTLLHAPAANYKKQAFYIRGLYYSYVGEKVKALAFFNNCLKLDYRDMPAYREKAICLYDLHKYSSAVDVLKQALTVQNTFDEGYYWLGRCYEKLDKRKEAIESYQFALQFDPNYLEAKEALDKLNN